MVLSGEKLTSLMTRTMATAIANQAIIKCQLAGFPATIDNVILFVGDFFDPQDQDYAPLILEIERAISDVLEPGWLPGGSRHIT